MGKEVVAYNEEILARMVNDEWTQTMRKQPLMEHLERVGELAREKGENIGYGELLQEIGRYHDIGKAHKAWQDYLKAQYRKKKVVDMSVLRGGKVVEEEEIEEEIEGFDKTGEGKKPDHTMEGAIALEERLQRSQNKMNQMMAKHIGGLIAGHHNEIPDMVKYIERREKYLEIKDKKNIEVPREYTRRYIYDMDEVPIKWMSGVRDTETEAERGFLFFMQMKMLYSIMVDSDYKDSEEFDKERGRKGKEIKPDEGLKTLEKFVEGLDTSKVAPEVKEAREQVAKDCEEKAVWSSGMYTLTAPTGTGKTLSSLSYALRHAKEHNKKRIFYIAPFKAILNQNAGIYKEILGADQVLEHHSDIDLAGRSDIVEQIWGREDWNYSMVCTTMVQLVESVFSNRAVKSRKIHGLANSIILIDEMQTVPLIFVTPIMMMFEELVRNYGATVVFMTATQPTELYKYGFRSGIERPKELISDVEGLREKMDKVNYYNIGEKSLDEMAKRLTSYNTGMLVCNTREYAYRLAERLGGETTYYLTSLLTKKDRLKVIDTVVKRLKEGKRTHLIATRMVEMGVDFSFEYVATELAGIVNTIQSAGRCDRNGELKEKYGKKVGVVELFTQKEVEGVATETRYNKNASRVVYRKLGLDRAHTTEGVDLYFRELVKMYKESNTKGTLDSRGVMSCMGIDNQFNLRLEYGEIARRMQLIDEKGFLVCIPNEKYTYEILKNKVAIESEDKKAKWGLRKLLQGLSVNIYEKDKDRMLAEGIIAEVVEGIYILEKESYYTSRMGLDIYSMR